MAEAPIVSSKLFAAMAEGVPIVAKALNSSGRAITGMEVLFRELAKPENSDLVAALDDIQQRMQYQQKVTFLALVHRMGFTSLEEFVASLPEDK